MAAHKRGDGLHAMKRIDLERTYARLWTPSEMSAHSPATSNMQIY
jgi:hypothetical protein